MLWDISGENNAGKSQLAMQLLLTVQLPTKLGGIHGSACYITTRDELATPRLNGMIDHHPLLSPDVCGLTDIHTIKVPFFPGLQKVLLETVPAFADERKRTPGAKQLKLIVIDTLTDVFDQIKDPKYEDVPLRAKDLKKLSLLLHRLASKYQLAVVVLGATRETKTRSEGGDRAPGELRFSDQSRWFCRGHSIPGEDDHEAILGHVWPNQLNARIMMSRTIRTRARSVVDPRRQREGGRVAKRRRLEGKQERVDISDAEQQIPLRRFSVLFSSVGPPGSCDYVILSEGVVGIPIEE
ncbi:hypothetical protein BD413DRAFT_436288, partial [Trametes elegans]